MCMFLVERQLSGTDREVREVGFDDLYYILSEHTRLPMYLTEHELFLGYLAIERRGMTSRY